MKQTTQGPKPRTGQQPALIGNKMTTAQHVQAVPDFLQCWPQVLEAFAVHRIIQQHRLAILLFDLWAHLHHLRWEKCWPKSCATCESGSAEIQKPKMAYVSCPRCLSSSSTNKALLGASGSSFPSGHNLRVQDDP